MLQSAILVYLQMAGVVFVIYDPFLLKLQKAEEEANEILDRLLSGGDNPVIMRLDLGLRHREIQSEADVDALLDEVRQRLLPLVKQGARVRLL